MTTVFALVPTALFLLVPVLDTTQVFRRRWLVGKNCLSTPGKDHLAPPPAGLELLSAAGGGHALGDYFGFQLAGVEAAMDDTFGHPCDDGQHCSAFKFYGLAEDGGS